MDGTSDGDGAGVVLVRVADVHVGKESLWYGFCSVYFNVVGVRNTSIDVFVNLFVLGYLKQYLSVDIW